MVLVPPSVVSTERRTLSLQRERLPRTQSHSRGAIVWLYDNVVTSPVTTATNTKYFSFTREKTNRKRPPDANLESSLSSSTDLDSKEHSSQEKLTPCSLSTAGEIREAHPDNGK